MVKIREARKAKHMTQKELAKVANVSYVSISRYESGIRLPSVPTAQRIAAALGVEWTRFFEPINQQEEQSLETERQAM